MLMIPVPLFDPKVVKRNRRVLFAHFRSVASEQTFRDRTP